MGITVGGIRFLCYRTHEITSLYEHLLERFRKYRVDREASIGGSIIGDKPIHDGGIIKVSKDARGIHHRPKSSR